MTGKHVTFGGATYNDEMLGGMSTGAATRPGRPGTARYDVTCHFATRGDMVYVVNAKSRQAACDRVLDHMPWGPNTAWPQMPLLTCKRVRAFERSKAGALI